MNAIVFGLFQNIFISLLYEMNASIAANVTECWKAHFVSTMLPKSSSTFSSTE